MPSRSLALIGLRAAATVCLVGIVAAIVMTPAGYQWQVGFLSGVFRLSVATGSGEVLLTSASH